MRSRLVTLVAVRLAVSVLLLGSVVLLQVPESSASSHDPLYWLIGWTFALSAACALVIGQAERHPWIVDLQLALDALTVSAFVWVTGGTSSVLSPLYFLPIIAASVLRSRRGAVVMATCGSLLYAVLLAAQHLVDRTPAGLLWPSWRPETLPPAGVAEYTAAINIVGFFAVGLLSGSLAETVRRANVKLESASATIADLQAFNQHVIDSLAMGLVTTDLLGRVLTFNDVAEQITGHAAATARGRNGIELLQIPPAFAASLTADVSVRTNARVDYRYRRPTGEDLDIGLAVTALMTSAGRSGLLFTFQDTTAFHKLEREARVQQRLAAVGEMAAGIAHEIRNPLGSISGSIQVLRAELALTAEQAQLMDIVLRESERLNRTISSFLAYARPQRFAIARIDLRAALQDAALLLRNSAETGDRHVIEVDAPLSPVYCEADEGQVRQIIWNLATNGLRAMPGGGRLQLACRASDDHGEAVIVVSDEGVGIGEAELDAVFQPFRGSFERGTGLGMAIVHRIVCDHGGEIRVTSKPGEGTSVEVRLPARAPVTPVTLP